MLWPDDIREWVKGENRPLEPVSRDSQPEDWAYLVDWGLDRAEYLVECIDELTEALEDAVTGCSNPRQPPGAVLAKYKEALDDND